MVRAKFMVTQIVTTAWGSQPGQSSARVVLEPRYDESIPEDLRFQKATPSGRIEMQIDNPAAVEQLVPGKAFYVEFTPAE